MNCRYCCNIYTIATNRHNRNRKNIALQASHSLNLRSLKSEFFRTGRAWVRRALARQQPPDWGPALPRARLETAVHTMGFYSDNWQAAPSY